jgi:hypothetical protein
VGCGLAGENRLTHGLALQRFAVGGHHRQRPGIQLATRLQLGQGPLPLAQHTEQLKEEDAQLGIARARAHILLQAL